MKNDDTDQENRSFLGLGLLDSTSTNCA